jgi:glycosyltransferase involved in cell wall biosynthesis
MTTPQRLPITVIVATKNEAPNIGRCLAALARASRVIVVDSHSTDATPDMAREHGADVVDFSYAGGHPRKRQWALDTLAIHDPWVMLIDADEVVPPRLWDEIAATIAQPSAPAAFLVTKGFHFLGRRFRFGGFSHAAVLLFQRGRARFERPDVADDSGHDMEVHERMIVDGDVGRLRTPLVHEDFKGLDAYRDRHRRYAVWEANVRHRFLVTGRFGEDAIDARLFGNAQERRRFLKRIAIRMPFEPAVWFIYHFILRLGFLEGRAGFIASRIRAEYIADVRRRVRALRATSRRSVVLLNRFYWPDVGATSQMLTDLAEDLASNGWTVTVVTSRSQYDGGRIARPTRETRNGVTIVRVRGTSLGRHTAAGRLSDAVTYMAGAMWTLLRISRPAVIVSMTDPPLLVSVAAVAAKLRRARMVHWVQDLYPQIAAGLGAIRSDGLVFRATDFVARRAHAACDLVVTLGPRMREASLAAGSAADRTRVIHNWADARAIAPLDERENEFLGEHQLAGKFVVLYSGNAGRAHTFDAVLGAMRRLRDDPGIVFVFVGGGGQWGVLRGLVEREALPNARFMGYVPRERLSHSLSAASLSLVTESPNAEGFLVPSKVYGILASGRPVVFVGSPTSDVARIVRGGECGFVVAPDDPGALVDVIMRLRHSHGLRSALGRRARQAAEEVYDRRIATSAWSRELAAIL